MTTLHELSDFMVHIVRSSHQCTGHRGTNECPTRELSEMVHMPSFDAVTRRLHECHDVVL